MTTPPFYLYTGVHAFLIGLFPFYLPVYLYGEGLGISSICLFVAATGMGFCLTLYLFDRLRTRLAPVWLIGFSFVSELLLLVTVLWQESNIAVLPTGLVNGVFACLFWTVQRLLFVGSVHPGNSGNHFGNTQLMVMLSMKAAILLGGFLLEHGRETAILLCSAVLVSSAAAIFMIYPLTSTIIEQFSSAPPLSLKNILSFKDNLHSRSVFIVDGIFLYLESYFWLISVFLFFSEDFSSLGLVTVLLALLFGGLYLIIKKTIDRCSDQPLYKLAVVLYFFSWLMRAAIDEIENPAVMVPVLAVIAFCTSLFRLSFNKRFFDNANFSTACHHIMLKSYISQLSLSLFFMLMALVTYQPFAEEYQLTPMYLTAALLTPVFFLYRSGDASLLVEDAAIPTQTSVKDNEVDHKNRYRLAPSATVNGRVVSRQRRMR